MHVRTLTATAVAVVLMGSSAAPAAIRVSASARSAAAQGPHSATAARSSRPNRTDWNKIKTAAHLRNMALAPHRTARFRSFTATLGLGQLSSIHPLAPGRCLTAVTYLYDNLLDLENAFPGENWGPLRRAVAKEPSIHACAPRPKDASRSMTVTRQAERPRDGTAIASARRRRPGAARGTVGAAATSPRGWTPKARTTHRR
jgi:hypothetical protein